MRIESDKTADQQLGTRPIPALIARLAVPSIAAQLINVLYTIIDRIFIGNIPDIGVMALTGVGVTFPIITLISAFAAFAGQGSASLAAIRLGAGDRAGAEQILGNALTLILLLSAGLTTLFRLFNRPLLFAFGASANTIGYALSYLNIYLLGTLFVQLTLGLNMFIGAQGRPDVAMRSVLVGAIVHIALDPVMIFWAGWGVAGAAWSTVISQGISAAWTVHFLVGPKTSLRIRLKNLRPRRSVLSQIARMGLPPFCMQSTDSLVSAVMNTQLLCYGGDLAVGVYTVLQSVMQMLTLPVSGLTQGAQPIVSYNYGAQNNRRARDAYWWMLGLSLAVTSLGCALAMLFPGWLARLFTQDPAMVAALRGAMPLYFAGIWAFGAQAASQTTFMGLGQARISLFLSLLRKVFLMVPLAFLLPRLTHSVTGIFAAEPIADFVASAVTFALFLHQLRRLLPVEER
ncbi:MAG: MATE family efflux transporter [Gemmiger sp.]|nr:MATE family efflux transporter [Gemmiger sp.]